MSYARWTKFGWLGGSKLGKHQNSGNFDLLLPTCCDLWCKQNHQENLTVNQNSNEQISGNIQEETLLCLVEFAKMHHIPIKITHITNPSRFYCRDLTKETEELEQIKKVEKKLKEHAKSRIGKLDELLDAQAEDVSRIYSFCWSFQHISL